MIDTLQRASPERRRRRHESVRILLLSAALNHREVLHVLLQKLREVDEARLLIGKNLPSIKHRYT